MSRVTSCVLLVVHRGGATEEDITADAFMGGLRGDIPQGFWRWMRTRRYTQWDLLAIFIISALIQEGLRHL